MTEIEFLMAIAIAHKAWKNADCAIQFRPNRDGWRACCVTELPRLPTTRRSY